MKNHIKCKLMDEILLGGEIYVGMRKSPSEYPYSQIHWALYNKRPGNVYNELFRWEGPLNFKPSTTKAVTLKDALEMVDTYWNNRVERREGEMSNA